MPILGLGAVLIYVALTVAAIALYPGSTSPVDRYLSELGNADLSPDGWAFYDLAMILGGLLEIPFFVAVSRHYREYGSKKLVRTGLVAGILNGLSVFMAGVFAEHVNMGVHLSWSLVIFLSFIPLLVAYGVILWKSPGLSRVVSLFGYIAVVVDMGLLAALLSGGTDPGPGSVMEWVSVFAFLAWVALVSVDLLRRLRVEGSVQSA